MPRLRNLSIRDLALVIFLAAAVGFAVSVKRRQDLLSRLVDTVVLSVTSYGQNVDADFAFPVLTSALASATGSSEVVLKYCQGGELISAVPHWAPGLEKGCLPAPPSSFLGRWFKWINPLRVLKFERVAGLYPYQGSIEITIPFGMGVFDRWFWGIFLAFGLICAWAMIERARLRALFQRVYGWLEEMSGLVAPIVQPVQNYSASGIDASLVALKAETRSRVEALDMATVAAHDLQGPIDCVHSLSSAVEFRDARKRSLYLSSVVRLDALTKSLLYLAKPNKGEASAPTQVQGSRQRIFIPELLELLLLEKKLCRAGAHLELQIEPEAESLFCRVPGAGILSALSNLLDNAIEAASAVAEGRVTVRLKSLNGGSSAQVQIEDNGGGMTSEVLQALGKKGATQGKERGHGLGVYSAIQQISKVHGEITFDSRPGGPTRVTVEIPAGPGPNSVQSFIWLGSMERVALVTPSLASYEALMHRARASGVEVVRFGSVEEMLHWWLPERPETTIILDMDGPNLERCMEEVSLRGLEPKTIISGSLNFRQTIWRCAQKFSVRVMSSTSLGRLNLLRASELDTEFVLLDDNRDIASLWTLAAEEKSRKIATYSDLMEFYRDLPRISKTAKVYVDCLLGVVRGENVAWRLAALGYEHVYLSTGLDETNLSTCPGIRGVVGKVPPF